MCAHDAKWCVFGVWLTTMGFQLFEVAKAKNDGHFKEGWTWKMGKKIFAVFWNSNPLWKLREISCHLWNSSMSCLCSSVWLHSSPQGKLFFFGISLESVQGFCSLFVSGPGICGPRLDGGILPVSHECSQGEFLSSLGRWVISACQVFEGIEVPINSSSRCSARSAICLSCISQSQHE